TVRKIPASVPANNVAGSVGWTASARTSASINIPTQRRWNVSPLSRLRQTPWPVVPANRMVVDGIYLRPFAANSPESAVIYQGLRTEIDNHPSTNHRTFPPLGFGENLRVLCKELSFQIANPAEMNSLAALIVVRDAPYGPATT